MSTTQTLRRAAVPTLLLFTLWLLLSGHYTVLTTTLGLVSSMAVALLAVRLNVFHPRGLCLPIYWRTLTYLPWLLREIVKANIDVTRRILDPRLPISPRVVHLSAGQKTDLGVAIYANSITLTPGTLSIDVEFDDISVHALSANAAADLEKGEMNRRVCALEGKH
ncbi:MAG: Na+/H+ antiporter subunit E [Gammaproteobacteria bacterium]